VSVDSGVEANVDPGEIAKFEALAERWWDPEGDFKPLHAINPLRLGYIERRIGGGRSPAAATGDASPLAGKRVLDIGCGGGILAESLAARGARVTAIDLATAPLAVARVHARESGVAVSYERAGAEAFAATHPGAFDIVTCLEMLEHVPDPASTVAACARLARPDGDLFFATINRNPKAYLLAIVGAEHVLKLLPKGTHDYAKFLRPSELDRFARASGLLLEDIIGMHYNPLTGRYRLGPGVDVNYLAHFRRPGPAGASAASNAP